MFLFHNSSGSDYPTVLRCLCTGFYSVGAMISIVTLARREGIAFGSCLWIEKIEHFPSVLVGCKSYSVCWFCKLFVYWSNWFVILAVCLCVCQLHTVHNFKLIVIKLFQVGEVVSTETPLDFEVKGHLEVKFQISSFFIRLTWNLKKICTLHHRIGKPTLVEVKRSKVKSRSNF